MSNARQGRGQGNGGKRYRESSFWDKLEKAKKQLNDSDLSSGDRKVWVDGEIVDVKMEKK